jgi:hypothetical protein
VKRYRKMHDGEPAIWPEGVSKMACCDCGLVHLVKIETTATGGFVVRAWRDNRSTAAKRRSKKGRKQ